MMQATKSRLSDHAAASHCRDSGIRSLFVQPKMRSIPMIVIYVIGEQPSQMAFVHGDNVIEKISSTTSYPSLCDSVLPRASK